MPHYAYLPIPANSSDFGYLRSSVVANEAILAVIIACVIHK